MSIIIYSSHIMTQVLVMIYSYTSMIIIEASINQNFNDNNWDITL